MTNAGRHHGTDITLMHAKKISNVCGLIASTLKPNSHNPKAYMAVWTNRAYRRCCPNNKLIIDSTESTYLTLEILMDAKWRPIYL